MDTLWMFDFNIFYLGARAVLSGLSPYSVGGFISPFPLAVLFIPFTLLPQKWAYAVFAALSLFALFRICRWRGVWALLSFPVLFGLFTGQVDLLLALALPVLPAWGLGLALVKPQLAWLALPWLARRLDRRGWLQAAAGSAALLGLCFLLRPGWVSEWAAAQPALEHYAQHATSLYWLVPASSMRLRAVLMAAGAVLAFPAGFLIRQRAASWSVMQLFQPLTNLYSASALAEWIGPVEVGLSWLVVLAVGGEVHNGMPLFVVALSILTRREVIPWVRDLQVFKSPEK